MNNEKEIKLIENLKNGYMYVIEDIDYGVTDTIQFLIKTLLSISLREKNIKVLILKEKEKEIETTNLTDLQIEL